MIGIGTDIVDITRIETLLAQYGERFAARILSPNELVEFQNTKQQAHFLAKRFAAKEAVAKAFSTGFREGLVMTDIEVGHEESGKPILIYHREAAIIAKRLSITSSFLSLSDEKTHAIAFVILL